MLYWSNFIEIQHQVFVLTSFATLSSTATFKQETSFYNPWLLLQSIIWPKKKLYFRILHLHLQSIIWSGKKLHFRIFDLLQSAEYYRTSHMALKSHQIMLEICETKKITKTWSKSFRFQIIWKSVDRSHANEISYSSKILSWK